MFKYRGGDIDIFNRDLESIENDTFWAPRRDALNDPCEGLVSPDILHSQIDILFSFAAQKSSKVNEAISSVKASLNDVLEKKDSCGVYSLSKSNTDELLWAHYAYSHTGFCIEYDLDTLIHFGGSAYYNFDVNYSNQPPKLSIDDMMTLKENSVFFQKLIGVKSSRWLYETEHRVVTSESGLQDYDYRAVKAIHFGLRMPKERIEQLMSKLRGRSIKYYQMGLKGNSYELIATPLEDMFPTDRKYKYSIAPIANLAVDPSSLDPQWTDFAPYLEKVAEIVRREPYCDELQMVEVSHDKSRPGKPIFFGSFQRSRFRYENIYFSPEDVNEQYGKITDLGAEISNV